MWNPCDGDFPTSWSGPGSALALMTGPLPSFRSYGAPCVKPAQNQKALPVPVALPFQRLRWHFFFFLSFSLIFILIIFRLPLHFGSVSKPVSCFGVIFNNEMTNPQTNSKKRKGEKWLLATLNRRVIPFSLYFNKRRKKTRKLIIYDGHSDGHNEHLAIQYDAKICQGGRRRKKIREK